MRFKVLSLSLFFASFCWSDTIIGTITNSKYGTNPTTSDVYNAASNPNGVIADRGYITNFEIKDAILSSSTNGCGGSACISLEVQFDYGFASGITGSTLPTYQDAGLNLNVGDVLFYDPSGTVQYGIEVAPTPHAMYTVAGAGTLTSNYSKATGSNSTLTQGTLYSINNGGGASRPGVLTAQQALTSSQTVPSGETYRPNTAVWINDVKSSSTADYSITIAPDHTGGQNSANPLTDVTVTFLTANLPTGFLTGLEQRTLGLSFASADCANDVISGTFTPEPSSLALAAGGLLLAGIGLLRRKRAV